MAPRRNIDRAAWESRSHREPTSRRMDRLERYSDRGMDRYDRRVDRYGMDPERHRVESELDRDFAAMKRVWQMIRAGAVRMLGEVGRQY